MYSPFRRWATSAITFGLCFGSLYAWKGQGIEAAGNLLQFYLWFLVVGSWLIVSVPNAHHPATVPPKLAGLGPLNLIQWIALIGALVAFGHFVLGVFLLLAVLIMRTNRARYDDAGNLKQAAQ